MDRLEVGQQWTDKTGNGRHLTGWPSDPLRQPAKVVASLNGQPGADYRNVGTISLRPKGSTRSRRRTRSPRGSRWCRSCTT
jgi:hypothetical protein